MEIGERQTQNESQELPARGEKHRFRAEAGAPPDTSPPPHGLCYSGLLAFVPCWGEVAAGRWLECPSGGHGTELATAEPLFQLGVALCS